MVFAAVTSLTPGPNVVLVTASAANFGFGRTVPQMLGITGGFWVLVMAVELGLAGLVHAEPRIQTVLRYAGGLGALAAYTTVGGDVLWETLVIAAGLQGPASDRW